MADPNFQDTNASEDLEALPIKSLSEYGHLILENFKIVLAASLVCAFAVFLYYSRVPNMYSANVQLLVEKVDKKAGKVYEQVIADTSGASDEEYYGTQLAILTGSKYKKIAVEELGIPKARFRVVADRQKGTRILNLRIMYTDPKIAADIANKFAHIYIRESSRQNRFVSEQILKLLPSENEIKAESSQDKGLEGDEDIDAGKRMRFAEIASGVMSDPTLQQLQQEQRSIESQLQELSRVYKPQYPLIKQLTARLEVIKSSVAEQKKILVERLRANLAGEFSVDNIRILERAYPASRPSEPKRLKLILFGTLFGFAMGIFIVIAKDIMSPKIHTEKDVLLANMIPFFGSIPVIESLKKFIKSSPLIQKRNLGSKTTREKAGYYLQALREGSQKLMGSDKNGRFASTGKSSLQDILKSDSRLLDAVVDVRTHILYSLPQQKSKRIMFTSSIPDEGKTLVASLFALSLANMGEKILLVDADIRRSFMHEYLGVGKQKGLTDYLQEEVPLEEVIQKVPDSSLNVILAGELKHNPTGFFSSDRFQKLLEKLSSMYDRVIIDVAPALFIPDAFIISSYVPSKVLVCASGSVDKKTIKSIVKKFEAAGQPFIGLVLNKVSFDRKSMSYNYKYYSSFSKYYQPHSS